MRIPPTPPKISDVLETRAKDWADLASDAAFQRVVKNCQARYYHWDKVRWIARNESVDPEMLWAWIKMNRMAGSRRLPLEGVHGRQLWYSLTEDVQHEQMMIDRNLSGAILTGEESPFDSGLRERFIHNAFQEEAIASSLLEGAATTRRDAKAMLRSGRKPKKRGERMVLNNYNAIQYVRDHREAPLTVDLLVELQEILTADTLDDKDQVGRFRLDSDNVVVEGPEGNVIHEPPQASELRARLLALCQFANDSTRSDHFVHPFIVACVLHYQIGFDHPFCDGNGRTARAIFYWQMLRSGYWLFEYLPISRLIYKSPSKYGRAFLYTETDDSDLTYFMLYKARVIAMARGDLSKFLANKQKEVRDARSWIAIDQLLNHRQREVIVRARSKVFMVTIASHQRMFDVSYGTAHKDLEVLAARGYLKRTKIGRRFEYWRGDRLDDVSP